ncbi:hypothetical protein [Planctomicrobium sp. SH664]|uniref:hypothetical protein n=1 Tax=Planctomicrobium sp. SH664 TaxID=3448125 RepID=UPI003F5B5D09
MSTATTTDEIESVSLRLRTPESTADAAAVASMLHALVVLIEETNERIGDQREIAIRVRPFEEGSLEIPFDLIVYGGLGLLALNDVASRILKTIQQAVDLKKSLQGKPPETLSTESPSQSPTIVNSGDNVVINIVQNPQVTAALHQAFVDIEKDKAIDGVQLVNNATQEEIVNISRQEFPYFKYPDIGEDEELPDERIRGEHTTLVVHSPVLAGKAKWKFLYEGKTISASMADEAFRERVRGRAEQFGAGDRLQVLLEIGEKYDESTSAYRRTGQYVVRQVLKHSPPPPKRQQKELFEE